MDLDVSKADFALFVAAHELFHTLGASDQKLLPHSWRSLASWRFNTTLLATGTLSRRPRREPNEPKEEAAVISDTSHQFDFVGARGFDGFVGKTAATCARHGEIPEEAYLSPQPDAPPSHARSRVRGYWVVTGRGRRAGRLLGGRSRERCRPSMPAGKRLPSSSRRWRRSSRRLGVALAAHRRGRASRLVNGGEQLYAQILWRASATVISVPPPDSTIAPYDDGHDGFDSRPSPARGTFRGTGRVLFTSGSSGRRVVTPSASLTSTSS